MNEKIKFEEKPRCEHCGDLEPFTPVYEDEDLNWCLSCAGAEGLIKLSIDDNYEIEIKETELKIEHYQKKIDKLLEKVRKLENHEI